VAKTIICSKIKIIFEYRKISIILQYFLRVKFPLSLFCFVILKKKMDWTKPNVLITVVLAVIVIGAFGSILATTQLEGKQARYCETYEDTTTYNVSNNICYEATNTSNTNDPVANTGFNIYADITLYVILGVVLIFMVGVFLKKKMA